VATVLAPQSRNRRAGELLADGVPTADIPERVGQAVESLESVPLLARALDRARLDAPVTQGLSRLIAGDLPLDDWVALVRTTVPPPARWRPVAAGFWARARVRVRRWGRREPRPGAQPAS
jgi:glycerol-3-phosphate dehydrogenase (NAD(P)+)